MVAEVLRSGAYRDEIVMNYVNRRFVATYYDVWPADNNAGDAWAHDEDASRVFGRMKPPRVAHPKAVRMRDGSVYADVYPAALFLAPDGEQIGPGLWGIFAPEHFLEALKKVAAGRPDLAGPTKDEARILAKDEDGAAVAAHIAAARLHWELADFPACLASAGRGLAADDLDGARRAELEYLLARAHHASGAIAKARAAARRGLAVAKLSRPDLVDPLRLLSARLLLRERKHQAALEAFRALAEQEEPGSCTGAAHYFAGLCLFRLNERDEAKVIWRRHRIRFPMDRLARRSAASLGPREVEAFTNQQLIDTSGWW